MWNYLYISLLLPLIQEFFTEFKKFLYNCCYKHIEVEDSSQVYKCLNFYIAKNCKTFSGLTVNDHNLDCSNYLPHKRLGIVSIAKGNYYVNYKSTIISLTVEDNQINVACLSIGYKKFDLLLDFLEHIKNQYDELYSQNISLYKYIDDMSQWRCFKKVKQRSFNTVILPKGTKNIIYSDIKKFQKNKDFYRKIGVTYKRTILLYSEPGCGKSSCITAMSNLLNLHDIYFINLKDPTSLENINKIPSNSIIVFEDIDRYFKPIRNIQDNSIITWEADFDLALLINFLDGISTPEDTYIIITANNIEILPDVLLRLGRIDLKIKFDYCTPEQLSEYAKLFYENISQKTIDKMIFNINQKKITMCKLQQIFIKNIDDPYKACDDLEKLD